MTVSFLRHAPCGGKSPSRRIIEFRGSEVVAQESSCQKHSAIGQQGSRVKKAGGGHVTGSSKRTGRWIVKFGAGLRTSRATNSGESSGHQHLPVGKQCRCLRLSLDRHTSRGAESTCRGIESSAVAS